MLDDLTKEVKAQLYERVKSPLFGAFAFAWVGWNYRVLLAVISGQEFKEKMVFIDQAYPAAWDVILHCGLGPLATAVLFLLAYPYPARWMYRYWAGQQKELKKVQQQMEDETPLTQEEAKALRKTSLMQAAEAQAELKAMADSNKELKERIRLLQEDNERLSKERGELEEAAKKAEEELAGVKDVALKGSFKKKSSLVAPQSLYEELPENVKGALGEHFEDSEQGARNLFLALVGAGGSASLDKLTEFFGANRVEIKGWGRVLTQIEWAGFSSELYFLTSAGEAQAVNLGVASNVKKIIL